MPGDNPVVGAAPPLEQASPPLENCQFVLKGELAQRLLALAAAARRLESAE